MAIRQDIPARDPVELFEEFSRALRSQVHTAVPGTVVSYDQATRRANVVPSLDICITRNGRDEVLDRPEIRDVPVVWPGSGGAGGVHMHGQLQEDDQVALVYSMRGYREWLKTLEPNTRQDLDGLASPSHPFVLPWFGTIEDLDEPAGGWGEGLWLQTRDGTRAVGIDNDRILALMGDNVRAELQDDFGELRYGMDIKARVDANGALVQFSDTVKMEATSTGITLTVGGTVLSLTAAGVAITAGAVTHGGTNIGNSHMHPVTTAPGTTGTPA